MERGLNAIFPLPIFLDQAEGTEYQSIQKELTTTKSKLIFNDTGSHLILNDDPFNSHFLSSYECNHTLNFINKTVDKFLTSLYGDYNKNNTVKWMIIESWMTKTIKGRSAREHSHGGVDISGVYYLDTNGSDGNLILSNIHSHLQGNILLYELINKGDIRMPLENGMIFLWPGQMKHRTLTNETDHERISLSFNIFLNRKGFGIPTSLN